MPTPATLTQSDSALESAESVYWEASPGSGETHLQIVGHNRTSIPLPLDVNLNGFASGVTGLGLGVGTVATTGAAVLIDTAAFTAIASTTIAKLRVGGTAAITIPTGTTAIAAGAIIDEPNLTATGTVTDAAALVVTGAPTEGLSNYAVLVQAGHVRIVPTATYASAATVDITSFRVAAATTTLTGTTQVTTVQGAVFVGTPTLTDASAVTVDQYSTVYIQAAPVAAGSVTLTLGYALHVAAGTTRLSGDVTTGGAAVSGARNTLGYATTGTVVTSVGVALHAPATSYTDAGVTGTIAVLATTLIASMTVLATNTITYTDAAGLQVAAPTASTGATFTRVYAVRATGAIFTSTNVMVGGNTATFASTQPVGAVVFQTATAPVGAITTGFAIYTDGTVGKKMIANGTASNIET